MSRGTIPGAVLQAPTTLHSGATANANGTSLNISGFGAVSMQITGTVGTAVVNFEVTLDGTNWAVVEGIRMFNGSKTATAGHTGVWYIPVVGFIWFRARISNAGGGTDLTIIARAFPAPAQGIATAAVAGAVDINNLNDPHDVNVTGSIPEYGWVVGDPEPTPTAFAFGAKVDPGTGDITTMYWDGASWEEVA